MLAVEILRHTPVWVWGIFAVLLIFGATQMRRRNVSPPLVFVLPAIMIPLSLFTVA
jgi:hypothetical protein